MTAFASPAINILAQTFALILANLRQAAAAQASRHHAIGPLITPVWSRLMRSVTRFEALVARVLAGQPRRAPRLRTERTAAKPRAFRLPSRFAWLVRLVPGAAAYGSQLQALLADPAMIALLAAEPGAGRIMRPLCHMLAITPGPALALPRRGSPPTATTIPPHAQSTQGEALPAAVASAVPRSGELRRDTVARSGFDEVIKSKAATSAFFR